MRPLLFSILLLGVCWPAARAAAQGMMPQPGMRPPQETPEKPEGPAEQAPEEEAAETDLPALPEWPGAERKKLELIEINGYLRFRADLYHNLNLGQRTIRVDTPTATYAPFWTPISNLSDPRCQPSSAGASVGSCPTSTITGANMRLRIEPTINASEAVRVHTQIDVLDNLMLGSTPGSLNTYGAPPEVPNAFFSESQDPPIAGWNSRTPAVLVKRAWGEVDTPLGRLSFGRMGWHWGLGLLANDGQCWDCNFGDNFDRIMFETSEIARHRFGIGYDFSSNGPHTLSVLAGRPGYNGPWFGGSPVDLEQLDDVSQLFFTIRRMDDPEVAREAANRGDVVFNYGMYILWRKQDSDYALPGASGAGLDPEQAGLLNATPQQLSDLLIERDAWTWTGDLWLKLLWRKLSVELEAAIIGGEISNASNTETEVLSRDILQLGLVVRSRYLLFGDRLKLDFEIGSASGSDAELYDLNRRRQPLVVTDPRLRQNSLDEFRFDPDFLVDLILFREILGTVANATYFKPSAQFDLFDAIGARLDLIYSLANKPVAYPGNSPHLGFEIDLDLYYKNLDHGFMAGVQYGLLIPLAGLDRPQRLYLGDADGASIAQTVQARLIIKF